MEEAITLTMHAPPERDQNASSSLQNFLIHQSELQLHVCPPAVCSRPCSSRLTWTCVWWLPSVTRLQCDTMISTAQTHTLTSYFNTARLRTRLFIDNLKSHANRAGAMLELVSCPSKHIKFSILTRMFYSDMWIQNKNKLSLVQIYIY